MLVSAPDDYGLTAEETLAHVVAGPAPARFASYWTRLREEIATLTARWSVRRDVAGSEVIIPSVRSVRFAARVSLPASRPRGLVVTLPGDATPAAFPGGAEPWLAHGLATVRVHVRGIPPSTLDTGDRRDGWILRDITDPDAWVLRGAVGDVIQACRCARTHFGEETPLGLHGEGLGAGLAVLAAAELTRARAGPQRLVVAMPSLGDWAWRRDHYCGGEERRVNEMLTALREEGDRVLEGLKLFDAALHARDITCPSLCKLALRDDVVPAPTAAAVFNAVDTCRKWRFTVGYGHFDGGLADARRHARFGDVHPAFLDPLRSPEQVAALLEGAQEAGRD